MAFRILLTECASPLGAALLTCFETANYSIVCPGIGSFEWGDVDRVRAFLEEVEPALIINTLAWTRQPADAIMLQHVALSEASLSASLPVIHLSSHEVFPTEVQDGAVDECQEPKPDTSAGQTFLAAEQAVARVPRHILLRLPWLIDGQDALLESLCERLTQEQEFCLTDAWRGCPLQVAEAARVVLAMVHQVLCGAENWGVFHLHSSDHCSEAELADLAARALRKLGYKTATVVIVGRQARWLRTNGWLTGTHCTNKFGIQLRSWRQGIKTQIQAWAERTRPPQVCNSETGSG